MWRTLTALRRRGVVERLDVDLGDASLRTGLRARRRRPCPRGPGGRPRTGSRPGTPIELILGVGQLLVPGRIDLGRDDLGDAADPVDAVLAEDDVGQAVRVELEDGRLPGRVLRGARVDPAEVAAARLRGVGRDRLGDVLERLAALDRREGVVGGLLRGGLLGVRRVRLARVTAGSTAISQAWRCSLRVLLLEDPLIDLGVGDRDARLGGELGLDLGVDQLLEHDRANVAVSVVCWSSSLAWACAWACVSRPAATSALIAVGLLLEAERLDLSPLAELVLGDRLAVDRRAAARWSLYQVVTPTAMRMSDGDGDGDRRSRCSCRGSGGSGSRVGSAAVDGPDSEGHGVMRS